MRMNSLSVDDDGDDLKGDDVYLGSPAAMTCNVFLVSLVVSTTRSSLRNRMFSKKGRPWIFPSNVKCLEAEVHVHTHTQTQ